MNLNNFTIKAQESVAQALNIATASGQQAVECAHLMKDLKAAITEIRKGSTVSSQTPEDTYNSLGRYANNLNEMVVSGKLDPVIGRDDEIRRLLQILTRRTKNNPLLIGEPGVGKTAKEDSITIDVKDDVICFNNEHQCIK